MPTLSDLSALERTLRSALVLSVSCRNDATDPAARTAWRADLLHRLSALERQHAADTHVEREALQRAGAHVLAAVEAMPPATLMPGWVAFATAEGLQYAESLPVSVTSDVWWGRGPRLARLIVALPRRHAAAVAVVDARHVQLYTVHTGGIEAVATVQAERRPRVSGHMGAPPQPGFHPGTRGDVASDAAEDAKQASSLRMMGRAAHRLEAEAGGDGWIVIGGTHDASSALAKRLSPGAQLRLHLLRGLDVHASASVVHAQVTPVLAELEAAADQLTVAELLEADAAAGLATTGAPRALYALRVGAVDRLTMTEQFIDERPDLAEDAVRWALSTHARMGVVRGEAAADLQRDAGGIAVRLRYTPAAWTGRDAMATVEGDVSTMGAAHEPASTPRS